MAAKLDGHFNVLYRGREGLSAHEFIVDLRPFKATAGIVEEDVAKRLQVCGYAFVRKCSVCVDLLGLLVFFFSSLRLLL